MRSAGLTQSAIESIEGGGDFTAWPLDNIQRLLAALGLSLSWLDARMQGNQARHPDDVLRLGAELARNGSLRPDQMLGLDDGVIHDLRERLRQAGLDVMPTEVVDIG